MTKMQTKFGWDVMANKSGDCRRNLVLRKKYFAVDEKSAADLSTILISSVPKINSEENSSNIFKYISLLEYPFV